MSDDKFKKPTGGIRSCKVLKQIKNLNPDEAFRMLGAYAPSMNSYQLQRAKEILQTRMRKN